MMESGSSTAWIVATLACLFAGVLYAAMGRQATERLGLAPAMEPSGEHASRPGPQDRLDGAGVLVGTPADWRSPEPELALHVAQQEPRLERPLSQMEQQASVQVEEDAGAEAAPDRPRNGRFGVGYEWRMKQRRESQPDSTGAVGGRAGARGGGSGR
jgi:hypothetical protein